MVGWLPASVHHPSLQLHCQPAVHQSRGRGEGEEGEGEREEGKRENTSNTVSVVSAAEVGLHNMANYR